MKPEDKKRAKDARNDHTLHVALVMRDDVGKSDAILIAYVEGKAGLSARLNKTGAVS